MTLTVIDWMRKTAEWIAADRPDIYTPESALDDLNTHMTTMRELPGAGLTSFASYMLIRHVDEESDIEEWDLVRKISSVVNYFEEGEVWVHGHTDGGQALAVQIDLPDVDVDLDDDDTLW